MHAISRYTFQFALLRRGRNGNASTGVVNPAQQLRHGRKRPHQGQVFRLEQLAPPLLHLLAIVFLLALVEEHGDKLVATFADLAAGLLERHIMPEFAQRLLPRARMEVDGVNESSINVEDRGFRHVTFLSSSPYNVVRST